jgi:hypothetical protein
MKEIEKETHVAYTTVGWEYEETYNVSVIGHFEDALILDEVESVFYTDKILYTDTGIEWTREDELKFDEYSSGDLQMGISLNNKYELYNNSGRINTIVDAEMDAL